jgi:hypothetical protein
LVYAVDVVGEEVEEIDDACADEGSVGDSARHDRVRCKLPFVCRKGDEQDESDY